MKILAVILLVLSLENVAHACCERSDLPLSFQQKMPLPINPRQTIYMAIENLYQGNQDFSDCMFEKTGGAILSMHGMYVAAVTCAANLEQNQVPASM